MITPENSTTTCGEEVTADSPPGAPGPINPATGQHTCYYVLKPEEIAKGFVRPVRRSYKHVGKRPQYPLRDLTPEEHERYDQYGYVKYEAYPPDHKGGGSGMFWTEDTLRSGCGTVTSMSQSIAETYARQPDYYGATMCVGCGTHLPVGEHGEFVWLDDGTRVGT